MVSLHHLQLLLIVHLTCKSEPVAFDGIAGTGAQFALEIKQHLPVVRR